MLTGSEKPQNGVQPVEAGLLDDISDVIPEDSISLDACTEMDPPEGASGVDCGQATGDQPQCPSLVGLMQDLDQDRKVRVPLNKVVVEVAGQLFTSGLQNPASTSS